ncbi:hypothetical protein N9K90_03380 [Gammaproteobacteria bacterium]|nr:hypothetical protein [Gammaproteobacteria bacterium]
MNKAISYPSGLEFFLRSLRANFGDFIVLRGYQYLPSGYSNDIDIFIPKTKLKKFFSCVNNMRGIDASLKIIVSRLGLIKCELKINDESIPFDILYGFYYFGFEYQNLSLLSSRSTLHESEIFSVPDVSDEVRISLLKELLHNDRVRSDKADYLLKMIDVCYEALPTKYFPQESINNVKYSIINKELFLPKVSQRIKLDLIYFNFSEHFFKSSKNIILFIFIKYILKNFYHKYITK